MTYTVSTKASWSQTQRELAECFEKWGISARDWETNYPRGARLEGWRQSEEDRKVTLTYKKNDHDISLSMNTQARAVDNLRVLYLAVEAMRMNEKRGIGKIIESAYLQLAGPQQERSPWEVLGIYPGSPLIIAEAAYRDKAKKAHPDNGGSDKEMQEINQAIEKVRSGKV